MRQMKDWIFPTKLINKTREKFLKRNETNKPKGVRELSEICRDDFEWFAKTIPDECILDLAVGRYSAH